MHAKMATVIELSSGSDSDENIDIREKDRTFQMICRLAAQLALPKASLTNEGLFPHKLFKDLLFKINQKIVEMRNIQAKDCLFHKLLNIFQSMKFVFSEIRDDEKFNFLLTDFMALYVNFKCEQGSVKDANFTNDLLTKLHIIFSGNNRFIVITLLKVTCNRACTKALNPIFMKYLSQQKLYIANDIICYISLVLLFRKWKQCLSTSSASHVNDQGYLYNYCHISSIVRSILPPKVPLANETNQSFVRISDLIEFAMQNGSNGTNILLHNGSMDLNETIEKFIRQYEHYINRRHDLKLRRSVKAKSLRQKSYFQNGSSFISGNSDTQEFGYEKYKLSHRFIKLLRQTPEKYPGELDFDFKNRHDRTQRLRRREATAPEKIFTHNYHKTNKKIPIERKLNNKIIIISSSSSDEEFTDIPNRKRGSIPCNQIAKKTKPQIDICNVNGYFTRDKVQRSTNVSYKNIFNTYEFKIASDYQRLSMAIGASDINNSEDIQKTASTSKHCRTTDVGSLKFSPSNVQNSFFNANSNALIQLNGLNNEICSRQICSDPIYLMSEVTETHLARNANFKFNEFKNGLFFRKNVSACLQALLQNFARYASRCAPAEKISDVFYLNSNEKQFNFVINFAEENLEKLLRSLNIKYSLKMNYNTVKFFVPIMFRSLREMMDMKMLFEISPKNLLDTKSIEPLYKQKELTNQEQNILLRIDAQKYKGNENIALFRSVPLESDNMNCNYESEQKSWMKGLGLLPNNKEDKAKRTTHRRTHPTNLRKIAKRKKDKQLSAQLQSCETPDNDSPQPSSNFPDVTESLSKEKDYTSDMIRSKKANVKQKSCAYKACEWTVQKNENYLVTGTISGQQTKRKKRKASLESTPQCSYNFNSDDWKCEEKCIRNYLNNLRLDKLNTLTEKLLQALTSLPKEASVEAYFIINKIIVTFIFECLSSCSEQIPCSKRKYLAICQKTKMLQKKNINDPQIHDIEHKYIELKTFIKTNSVFQPLDTALNTLNKLKKCLFRDDWLQQNEPMIQNLTHAPPVEGDMFVASKASPNNDKQITSSNFANDNDALKVYQSPSSIIATTFDAAIDEEQNNKSWFGTETLPSVISDNKLLQLESVNNLPDISDAWCEVNGDGVWGSCDLDYIPDGSIIAHNTIIPIIPQENSEYSFDEPCMYEEVIEPNNEVFSEILNTNEKQAAEFQQSVGCSIFVGDAMISGILDEKVPASVDIGLKKRKSRSKTSKSAFKSNENLTIADVYVNNEQRKRSNYGLPEIEKKKKYKSNCKIVTF